MKIVPLTKDKYQDWNEFCLKSDDAWFWHTTDYLEFSIACHHENNVRSLSFMVYDDVGIMAICPLLLEEVNCNDHEINIFSNSIMGGYEVHPALKTDISDERKEKVRKLIFSFVDDFACKNNVKSAAFSFVPLANYPQSLKQLSFNYLMKYGYFNHSLNTQILDLTSSYETLNRDVRKGHKYDIKRGEKAYVVDIFDKNNITKDIFNFYRLLHHKASGRITRPLVTFDMMYKWILDGNGVLCGLKYNNIYIGFSLIITYKNAAYYGSASDDPDAKVDVPISHIIQWETVKWLKNNGFVCYEIGLQQYSSQLYDNPNQKDIDISLFKRGFGGKTITVHRGIKYYDKQFMHEKILSNLNSLVLQQRGE
ncbi:hypothetical protein A3J90_06980 [candidate division WOR-1 bacterium RIFOXYC2_FULL_37_10]|uniref:BioF2-like acetyltransferase domain-containing protein n=1 Tax=candidate division WOR-1 bacterium RIFOXYB2_FULL_37_13 TaxID=1802579 RepID=A0A1F4SQA0_UNCSA|nr:MAG: hypothetical protein A2310_07545 [candidate division WOR-1 bacterium RIFOXYB2_FULL_37_13]OGC34227.1 MAG: hypothetical protein A3J90_06980 [candidate division WOR-1 bacterium RIFOXYC2_FULL_37_10]